MFSLKQQVGIRFDGSEIQLKQFQILFDGVLVGYLPHGESQQIQALLNFPHEALTDDAIAGLELEVEDKLKIKTKVLRPEQYSRQFAEEVRKALAEESEDDE